VFILRRTGNRLRVQSSSEIYNFFQFRDNLFKEAVRPNKNEYPLFSFNWIFNNFVEQTYKPKQILEKTFDLAEVYLTLNLNNYRLSHRGKYLSFLLAFYFRTIAYYLWLDEDRAVLIFNSSPKSIKKYLADGENKITGVDICTQLHTTKL